MTASSRVVDVLVIGGGMAGLATASAAAEAGAHVLVAEKGDRIGGSAGLSAGILWTAPNFETLRRVCPDGDPARGRILVDGFESAIGRVRDTGVELSDGWYGQLGFGVAYRVDINGLLEHWRRTVESNGGSVLLETAARSLLTDHGVVCGATLTKSMGSEDVRASSVVLATGGFQGDRGKLAELVGHGADRLLLRSNPWSTGDGLRLGLDAGGSASRCLDGFYGHLMPYPIESFSESNFLPLTQYHSVHCILVNTHGRRFIDESRGDEVSNQASLRQPDSRAVLLFDEAIHKEYVMAEPYPHGQVVDRFAEAVKAGARFAVVDDLDELVAAVSSWGLPAGNLQQTLRGYRAAADGVGSGVDAPLPADPVRLQTPPFYALEVQPSITFTYGGLQIDPEGRVLDRDARVVAGLFAVGADAGGLYHVGYGGGLVLGLVFGPITATAALAGDARGHELDAPSSQGEELTA